ncbi:MAG: hypothetical protein J3Q66DRAFT_340087, partial [Benniella sp.]
MLLNAALFVCVFFLSSHPPTHTHTHILFLSFLSFLLFSLPFALSLSPSITLSHPTPLPSLFYTRGRRLDNWEQFTPHTLHCSSIHHRSRNDRVFSLSLSLSLSNC